MHSAVAVTFGKIPVATPRRHDTADNERGKPSLMRPVCMALGVMGLASPNSLFSSAVVFVYRSLSGASSLSSFPADEASLADAPPGSFFASHPRVLLLLSLHLLQQRPVPAACRVVLSETFPRTVLRLLSAALSTDSLAFSSPAVLRLPSQIFAVLSLGRAAERFLLSLPEDLRAAVSFCPPATKENVLTALPWLSVLVSHPLFPALLAAASSIFPEGSSPPASSTTSDCPSGYSPAGGQQQDTLPEVVDQALISFSALKALKISGKGTTSAPDGGGQLRVAADALSAPAWLEPVTTFLAGCGATLAASRLLAVGPACSVAASELMKVSLKKQEELARMPVEARGGLLPRDDPRGFETIINMKLQEVSRTNNVKKASQIVRLCSEEIQRRKKECSWFLGDSTLDSRTGVSEAEETAERAGWPAVTGGCLSCFARLASVQDLLLRSREVFLRLQLQQLRRSERRGSAAASTRSALWTPVWTEAREGLDEAQGGMLEAVLRRLAEQRGSETRTDKESNPAWKLLPPQLREHSTAGSPGKVLSGSEPFGTWCTMREWSGLLALQREHTQRAYWNVARVARDLLRLRQQEEEHHRGREQENSQASNAGAELSFPPKNDAPKLSHPRGNSRHSERAEDSRTADEGETAADTLEAENLWNSVEEQFCCSVLTLLGRDRPRGGSVFVRRAQTALPAVVLLLARASASSAARGPYGAETSALRNSRQSPSGGRAAREEKWQEAALKQSKPKRQRVHLDRRASLFDNCGRLLELVPLWEVLRVAEPVFSFIATDRSGLFRGVFAPVISRALRRYPQALAYPLMVCQPFIATIARGSSRAFLVQAGALYFKGFFVLLLVYVRVTSVE